jgi:hypothetical protein
METVLYLNKYPESETSCWLPRTIPTANVVISVISYYELLNAWAVVSWKIGLQFSYF